MYTVRIEIATFEQRFSRENTLSANSFIDERSSIFIDGRNSQILFLCAKNLQKECRMKIIHK